MLSGLCESSWHCYFSILSVSSKIEVIDEVVPLLLLYLVDILDSKSCVGNKNCVGLCEGSPMVMLGWPHYTSGQHLEVF